MIWSCIKKVFIFMGLLNYLVGDLTLINLKELQPKIDKTMVNDVTYVNILSTLTTKYTLLMSLIFKSPLFVTLFLILFYSLLKYIREISKSRNLIFIVYFYFYDFKIYIFNFMIFKFLFYKNTVYPWVA